MKHHFFLVVLLVLSLAGMERLAWAQAGWRELPPEARREMRQQMREHWQQERDIRREDGGRRWQDLPPEDKRRLREEVRERRAWPMERESGGAEYGRRRD